MRKLRLPSARTYPGGPLVIGEGVVVPLLRPRRSRRRTIVAVAWLISTLLLLWIGIGIWR